MIDQVAQLTNDTWENIFNSNIYNFLNLVSYIRAKSAMEKNEIEKFKRR
jgi:hypothetical protein